MMTEHSTLFNADNVDGDFCDGSSEVAFMATGGSWLDLEDDHTSHPKTGMKMGDWRLLARPGE